MGENRLTTTGRRKESIARIQLIPSDKPGVIVNNRQLDKYFAREDLRVIVKQPLVLTNTTDKLAIIANVAGGGERGQAEAIRHGISRALVLLNQTYKSILKQYKLLTRDPRMRERKKFGQEGARKRFQFSKR